MPNKGIGAARRRAAGLALFGVLLSFACGALLFAAIHPALASADEDLHLDYAWQVANGRLPDYERGPEIDVPIAIPKLQWAAHHPPLFYVLAAPAVEGLLADGRWKAAVLAGRGVTVVLGLLCLIALAWAAFLAMPGRRALWGVATAAMAAPLAPLIAVSASIYNDTLAVLTGLLALGIAIMVLRTGLTWPRVAAAAVVAAAGLATRASFLVTLLILLGALVAGAVLHGRRRIGVRLLLGGGAAAGVLAVAVAASGWFYLRNLQLTGSWVGARPEVGIARQGRSRHSIADVLTSPEYWLVLRRLLFPGPADSPFLWVAPVLLAVLGVLAVIAVLARRPWRRATVVNAAVAAALVAQAAGMMISRAQYISGAGGNSARYLLPALLPIALVLAGGALVWPRLRVYPLLATVTIGWLLLVHHWQPFQAFPGGATANGVPAVALVGLVAGLGVGLIIQAVGLRRVWALSAPGPAAVPGPRRGDLASVPHSAIRV